MTSDEQNVAQVGVELLEADEDIEGLYQIALGETDDDLKLPAVIVTAKHEEDTAIFLGGVQLKRYSLTVELRGIQIKDSADDLDEAFKAIDDALHPSSPQTVSSASLFKGMMMDLQTGSDSSLNGDARIRKRVYNIFAAEADGS
jgi:hypothetical protein